MNTHREGQVEVRVNTEGQAEVRVNIQTDRGTDGGMCKHRQKDR